MLTAIGQSDDWSSSLKKRCPLWRTRVVSPPFNDLFSPSTRQCWRGQLENMEEGTKKMKNPFPGWCWGLARQVGMPPDCQWAFPQAKAHWFASLRCSATERLTLTTVLLIRWYNIWTFFYIGMCCCLHISQKPGTQWSPMGDEVGASPNLAPNLIYWLWRILMFTK